MLNVFIAPWSITCAIPPCEWQPSNHKWDEFMSHDSFSGSGNAVNKMQFTGKSGM